MGSFGPLGVLWKGVVARNCKLLMNMQASHRVSAPKLVYTRWCLEWNEDAVGFVIACSACGAGADVDPVGCL